MESSNTTLLVQDLARQLTTTEVAIGLISTTLSCSISTYSLFFAVFRLKLNPILKLILITMILFNLTGTTVQLVGEIMLLLDQNIFSLLICRCLSYPAVSVTVGNFLMSSMISILRIYMSKLAASAKVAKLKIVLPMIMLGIIVNYLTWPLFTLISELNGVSTLISKCAMQDLPIAFVPVRILWFSYTLIFLAIGAMSDYKMYLFVKQRNKTNAKKTQLVPWVSNQENLSEDLDIPIKATIMSTVAFLILMLAVIFIFADLFGNIVASHIVVIASTTLFSSTLPILMIFFTIKRQNKIQNAQPPAGLQLHNIDVDDDDEMPVENQAPSGIHNDSNELDGQRTEP